jgi:NADH:ubiquinone oxidoreductase subunit 2 (subunit N)
MVVAGFGYAVLALAAALRLGESDGLRASVVQLLGVTLAALLGGVGSSGREPDGSASLGTAARGLAWLTLLGLPPTLGFHGKVMVYHSLLSAGWGGVTALAMAASGAGLLPALRAIRGPRIALRGPRALLAVALMGAIILLGLYPRPGLALAGLVERLAGSA